MIIRYTFLWSNRIINQEHTKNAIEIIKIVSTKRKVCPQVLPFWVQFSLRFFSSLEFPKAVNNLILFRSLQFYFYNFSANFRNWFETVVSIHQYTLTYFLVLLFQKCKVALSDCCSYLLIPVASKTLPYSHAVIFII